MIRVNVSVADATVTEKETLTAGRVGLACAFTFSSEWDGLQKIAVFEGADSRSVALMDGDETVVPWECMAEAGYKLSVGVVGKNAQGDIVIPTVWARVGKIQLSPDDVPEGEEPTPSVVAQIEQAAANALMLARSVKEAADNGEFDGAQGPQGEKGDTGDPAGISRVYVDVDNGTGTPFANASVSGPDTAKQINFYFHNLKGPQGETGPAGEILSIAATVDNNTGTPSVGVTQMGTPSARRYALQFHNLKGAKGDKGDKGDPSYVPGPQGPAGPIGPAGVGVPAGGTAGQVLKKASGTNYDTVWGNAGSSITVDDALSDTSENPVQNKVVKAALDGKGTYSKPSGGIPASDLAPGAIGYSVQETIEREPWFDEVTVTTQQSGSVYVATLKNSPYDLPDKAIVSIDGTEYRVEKKYDDNLAYYGSSDFAEYPFYILDFMGFALAINTQEAETITVKGESYTTAKIVDPSEDFKAAVQKSESDPTVPAWAKSQEKPSYTAEEVGALPSDTTYASSASVGGPANKAVSLPMGHLDSTSTATVMTAQVDGITELRDGVCLWLQNGVVASASGVTLNINSLGAKPIYNSLSGAVVTTTFTAASTYLFVYNATRVTGGCWDMVYGYDTNTTYTPVKLGFGYATCSTAEATAAKTAALSSYTLTTGGIVAVKFTNAVPAGATLNINSKGAKAIYYKGAAITADVIKAGDTVTMIYSTYYHVLSIDRWGTDIAALKGQFDSLIVADNVGY